ncbi:uncharacterized protein LOC132563617 [Ylistrum balloti]|uniref:uncharacterized protein LOC132563617 n=1 Tax=Ylistrum balloti TaxID=509963 RepID=UPI002905EB9D|nr:uncharacterized protein LOC132563617 [Ylistrum balloti]
MDFGRIGKVNLGLGIIALLLEIMGFATRGWIRFKIQSPNISDVERKLGYQPMESVFEIGLWTTTSCLNGLCITVKNSEWDTIESIQAYADVFNIRQYQILASMAIGFSALGVLFLVFHFKRPVLVNKCNGLLSAGCFIIAGALMWYVVGKCANLATNLHPTLSYTEGLTAMAPYSVVVAAVGAATAFVVATLTLVEVFYTSCLSEGGIIISRFPTGQQHTLLNINHQGNPMAPPMASQTTHIGVTMHHPRV